VSSQASEALLAGKVILVTGAANGIGRAVAESCAREGARLVLNDLGCDREGEGRDPEAIRAFGRELTLAGATIVTDDRDLTVRGVPGDLVRTAKERFGRLDGVVSCAGILAERSVVKTDDAFLDRVLDVHVRAAFALLRAAASAMTDEKTGGSIVLMSGAAAFFGARGQAAIGGAQAAIVSLARSAALELRRHEIRVNALVPSARTRATEDLPTFAAIAERSMSADHVAPLVTFLLSGLSSEISGEIVGIAGTRAYGFRTRESPGAFAEGGPATPQWLAEHWRDVVR
jgi:NAD(P)-dependent dehydrogenase (short-subunit alcohol dehydrogenase family)